MYYLNTIYRNSEYGLEKFLPNLDWNCIRDNARSIECLSTSEDYKSAIEKYLDRGVIDFGTLIDHRISYYLSYYYLPKTVITEDLLKELKILIDDMKTRVNFDYIGNERLTACRTWTTICPTITSSTHLYKPLLRNCLLRNETEFIYLNGKIPQELIDFFYIAANDKYEKIDDNTHMFYSRPNNSKILLLSGTYDFETLEKYIHNALGFEEKHYVKNFTNNRVDYNTSSDTKDEQLKTLFKQCCNAECIRELIKTDLSIREFQAKYLNLLKRRESLALNLKNSYTNLSDVSELIKTLNKMNDCIKWDVENNSNHKRLNILCTTPIFNYDEGVVKRAFTNGSIKNYFNDGRYKWCVKLIEDCFIKNTRQFMTQTRICLDVENYIFSSHSYYSDVNRSVFCRSHTREFIKKQKYIPNPHISKFNCWGQNGPVLVNLATAKKWEEMLYCLKATLGNLNFNDVVVFEYLAILIKTAPDDYAICKDIATGKDLTVAELKKEME